MSPTPGARTFEDGIDSVDGFLVAAHHHAIAALEAPDAAGCPDVDVVDAFVLQLLRPADIVLVEAVPAVDDDVALAEQLAQHVDGLAGDLAGRQHDPDDARRFGELADQIFEARRARGAIVDELLDRAAIAIESDAVMSVPLQAADDVAAHSAETDYAELHRFSLSCQESLVGRQRTERLVDEPSCATVPDGRAVAARIASCELTPPLRTLDDAWQPRPADCRRPLRTS